jgi:hypothetical protein
MYLSHEGRRYATKALHAEDNQGVMEPLVTGAFGVSAAARQGSVIPCAAMIAASAADCCAFCSDESTLVDGHISKSPARGSRTRLCQIPNSVEAVMVLGVRPMFWTSASTPSTANVSWLPS